MRGETVFKQTFNRTMEYLSALEIKSVVPSENVLTKKLKASRTTVRKVLSELHRRKILIGTASKRLIAKHPKPSDYFPDNETVATSAQVEKKFMEWMLRGDRKAGDIVNGLELARQFGVSTSAIREYLNRFSRFGLIGRRPNSSWIILGFTKDFALELFEVRELFDTRSAIAFGTDHLFVFDESNGFRIR